MTPQPGGVEPQWRPSGRPSRGVVAALLALVVLALLGLRFVSDREDARRSLGGFLEFREDGVYVEEVVPGAAGDRAGLRPGDRLNKVGGRVVDTWQAYDQAVRDARTDGPVEYEVERDGSARRLAVRLGEPFRVSTYLAVAASVLVHLGLALVILLSGARGLPVRLLALVTAAVAIELALPSGYMVAEALGVFSGVAFWALNGLQFGTELHLAALIPERHAWLRRSPRAVYGLYGLGLGFGGVMAAWEVAEPGSFLNRVLSTRSAEVVLELWYLLWPLGLLALLGGAALLWPRTEGRHQAQLVCLGVLPWVVYAVWSSADSLRGVETAEWLLLAEPLIFALVPAAMFVALYRYRLFDLELVVKRGIVYSGLSFLLLLGFYGLLGVGGALVSRWVDIGRGTIWVVGAATLALGLAFNPLRVRVEALVERWLFPERGLMRARLLELARDLPSLGGISAITAEIVSRLTGSFGVSWASVLLVEGESGLLVTRASTRYGRVDSTARPLMAPPDDLLIARLERNRSVEWPRRWRGRSRLADRFVESGAELCLPLSNDDGLIGLVVLGEKVEGRFSAEEIELLTIFAHQIAGALENVRLFASATIDRLTGLLRREPLLDQLEREAQRARRYDRPFAVGMVDVDRFKSINDDYGHLAGDLILRRVAETMSETLRSTDVLGRYGGDEFLILLPETERGGAVQVAELLREAVGGLEIRLAGGRMVRVTVSVGVADILSVKGAGDLSQQLLAAADSALYAAKNAGRDRVDGSVAE